MKKSLIIGGAGFIGLHLARELANQGQEVTILDNFARSTPDKEFSEVISRENVKFIKADITEKESFSNLGSFDYVYHLAAINGTDNFYKIPDKVLKVGVLGTINTLDWFVSSKSGKLLYASSSEAYAGALNVMKERFPIPTPEQVPLVVEDPSNVRWSYGAGKIISEVAIHSWAKARGLKNFSIVRYHNIYGPRMGNDHVIPQFIQRITNKENPFNIFGGSETRTFCYVDDDVRATQLIMEDPSTSGQTYNIGRSDEEIQIIELAKALFKIADFYPEIDIKPAPIGSVMRRCPDVTKISGLGFKPQVSLNEGLKRTYDWYKAHVT